jgi:hypothetical protein
MLYFPNLLKMCCPKFYIVYFYYNLIMLSMFKNIYLLMISVLLVLITLLTKNLFIKCAQ